MKSDLNRNVSFLILSLLVNVYLFLPFKMWHVRVTFITFSKEARGGTVVNVLRYNPAARGFQSQW
jgi:hypothetical protein